MNFINKKNLFIFITLITAILLSFIVYNLSKTRRNIEILNFNNSGVSFNYPSSLKIKEKEFTDVGGRLILSKAIDDGTISIEAMKIPNSYKRYTLEEMSEVALANLKDRNREWVNKYSEVTSIGNNYETYSYLLEDSKSRKNAALYIGSNEIWLFNIIIESNDVRFDVLQVDADVILNSFKAI